MNKEHSFKNLFNNETHFKKMNISYRTVEEYRAEAMKKMQAKNLKELITMVIICKLHKDKSI